MIIKRYFATARLREHNVPEPRVRLRDAPSTVGPSMFGRATATNCLTILEPPGWKRSAEIDSPVASENQVKSYRQSRCRVP